MGTPTGKIVCMKSHKQPETDLQEVPAAAEVAEEDPWAKRQTAILFGGFVPPLLPDSVIPLS